MGLKLAIFGHFCNIFVTYKGIPPLHIGLFSLQIWPDLWGIKNWREKRRKKIHPVCTECQWSGTPAHFKAIFLLIPKWLLPKGGSEEPKCQTTDTTLYIFISSAAQIIPKWLLPKQGLEVPECQTTDTLYGVWPEYRAILK